MITVRDMKWTPNITERGKIVRDVVSGWELAGIRGGEVGTLAEVRQQVLESEAGVIDCICPLLVRSSRASDDSQ